MMGKKKKKSSKMYVVLVVLFIGAIVAYACGYSSRENQPAPEIVGYALIIDNEVFYIENHVVLNGADVVIVSPVYGGEGVHPILTAYDSFANRENAVWYSTGTVNENDGEWAD